MNANFLPISDTPLLTETVQASIYFEEFVTDS